jgi:hypothetical protein
MNTLLVILNLIPAIIKVLKAIEEAIPMPGQGAAKLDTVIEVLTTTDATLQPMIPQIKTTVGALVRLLNATGVFKKSA